MCRLGSVSISSAMRLDIVKKFKAYNFGYVRRTYKRLFINFLSKSGIHGLKALLATPKWRYAKITWVLFLIYIIIQTHYIIGNLVANYAKQPTEIHMSTDLVHVSNIPFPGVAVCSSNKFSSSKLLNYAELVYQAQQRYQPELLAKNVSDMAEQLLILGGLYVYPFYDYALEDTRAEKLHNILLHMYNGTEYTSREILRKLAPDCEDLVVRGMIFGERVNASKYFHKRMTTSSICCMFNYRRKSFSPDPEQRAANDAFMATLENVTFQANNILNSVQFVLQQQENERTFGELDTNAFQIYIFPEDDFPTIQTDTVGEIVINKNSIVEIPIQPSLYFAGASIRNFSPKVRNCYYLEEGQRLLNLSYYSFDECLLICRMQSMVRYCGCVSPPMPGILINATECNLLQLACLSQWKSVWSGWSYFSYVSEKEDDADGEDTAGSKFEQCAHCLPVCSGVNYKIEVNEQPLRIANADSRFGIGLLKGLTNTKPLAVIRLFFKQTYAQSTETDIVGNWLVFLNRFGGIMSLFYGFSIIGYIEIIYYLSGKWFYYIYKALTLPNEPKKKSHNQPQALTIKKNYKYSKEHDMEYTLYWQELQPKNFKINGNAKNIGYQHKVKY